MGQSLLGTRRAGLVEPDKVIRLRVESPLAQVVDQFLQHAAVDGAEAIVEQAAEIRLGDASRFFDVLLSRYIFT